MSTGRNEPCPCGSGKKHKKCCLPKASTTIPVEDRSHVTDEQKLKMVTEKICSVIGSPLRPLVPRGVAVAALAHWTGYLARLTLRQPEDLEQEVRQGHARVPKVQLLMRVLAPEDVAPVSTEAKLAVVSALARAQLDHPGVKIGSAIWVHTFASMTGQMARLLGRSADEAMGMVLLTAGAIGALTLLLIWAAEQGGGKIRRSPRRTTTKRTPRTKKAP